MKIFEIFEARRNPNLNPKTPINQIIDTALANAPGTIAGVPNLFVSFTRVDKLGINPRSAYDTPLGIYAYPAEYVKHRVGQYGEMSNLPFAGDQPYVNIFSAKGNIINLTTMTEEEEKSWYGRLKEVFPAIAQAVDSNSYFAARGAYFKTAPGGRFWYVMYKLSKFTGEKPPLRWNKMFRLLGIDGCIDTGKGIIHTNEPAQAVFFSNSAITNLKRFDNKYSPETLDTQTNERDFLVKKAQEIDQFTDAYDAMNAVNWNGARTIRFMKNKALRNEILLLDPDLAEYIVNVPSDIQEKILLQNIFKVQKIKRVDQRVLYDVLVKLKQAGELDSYAIGMIRASVKNLSPQVLKLLNDITRGR